MMAKKKLPVAAARERLRQAIDEACIARGEAQWMNGYRAGRAGTRQGQESDDELYRKEMQRFKDCDVAEASAERAMRAYALAIRRAT